ncbi:AmmeMemoRadiSam system protein B [Hydrogenophilus thermoluteolus]|uniref:MEMO1 family protein HPTL_0881 n=1 Tax=Hydrogenophilus thermoluteolus TaxID=297 RepID=A0A2Z6DXV2_HYDTE|nr:AmmeMemoRadiSam system protein B [Hydrogenophilus thermoluteolus]BBD77149.1 hypothetical protein HPTL_0881 [Hydrogenophilus thermoluteolus]
MHQRATTRQPAVSGLFYPSDPTTLAAQIAAFLRRTPPVPRSDVPPKALIVPHAGYVYSGPIAAQAYRLLIPFSDRIRRVVLFGPAHRVPVLGLALPETSAFRTPLGDVPVDVAASAVALQHPDVERSERAHLLEHALEVQLPFLQQILDDFAIVPFVVGWVEPHKVAEVMTQLWGGPETLIVVSSDLSHYHPDAEARALDQRTLQRILAFDPTLEPDDACGSTAIDALLIAAKQHGLTPELIAYGTSADTEGPLDRVVGYASVAWFPAHGAATHLH